MYGCPGQRQRQGILNDSRYASRQFSKDNFNILKLNILKHQANGLKFLYGVYLAHLIGILAIL